MPTLFSGNRITLPKSPNATKEEPSQTSRVTLLLTANQLLDNPKYKKLITQCQQLMDLTAEQVNSYITPLLDAFAEFVQNLPETRNSYYAKPGGFITHALVRTASALSMCRAYFTTNAPDKTTVRLSAQETLWMYALFSAGIFNGIGKIFSDFVIELYDENGKHIDRWNPFSGSMLKTKAKRCEYDFEDGQHIDLFSRRLSVLLAKQLMPEYGFSWLSSDKEVLSYWLALLEDNQRDSGTLGPFMVRSDALAINSYFDEKRMQREYSNLDKEAKAESDKIEEKEEEEEEKDEEEVEDKEDENKENVEEKLEEKKEKIELRFSASFGQENRPEPGSEQDKNEKRNPNPNTIAGIEFLKWLNNQMRSQRFEFNSTIFYMPSGAIFLPTGLFEEFLKKNPYYRSHWDVIESFNKLQLSLTSTDKNNLHSFIRTNNESSKKVQGIILNNAQLILPQNIKVQLSNGEKRFVNTANLSDHVHLFEPLQPIGKAHTPPPAEPKHSHTSLFRGR